MCLPLFSKQLLNHNNMINTLLFATALHFSAVYVIKVAAQFHPKVARETGYSLNFYIALVFWATLYYRCH